MIGNQVNVQNAQFTPFGAMPNQVYQPENIDLIMDVPLEVTVELGRTKNPFPKYSISVRARS